MHEPPRQWIAGSRFAHAFFNSLSVVFPRGEAFFVRCMRPYVNDLPEPLQSEVRLFIKQEVTHSREHIALNRAIVKQGYDVSRLEAAANRVIGECETRSEVFQLQATMCLEHLTAIIAAEVIGNPSHLEAADPEVRKLWQWHGLEEIEHKGVAFDTWSHVTRNQSGLRRWASRCKTMLVLTIGFFMNRTRGMVDLLRQDGMGPVQAWAGTARYAFGKGALARSLVVPWLKFFVPGFHPWQTDDSHLIDMAESGYSVRSQSLALGEEQGADEEPRRIRPGYANAA